LKRRLPIAYRAGKNTGVAALIERPQRKRKLFIGKNLRFVIGVAMMATGIAYLIYSAVRNTAEYYLTVNEVKARQTELAGQTLRVAGRVRAGTISWSAATLTLGFAMSQPPAAEPDQPQVTAVAASDAQPIAYRVIARGQPKPDMFGPGRDVIVEGRLTPDGTIEASQVLTSCPSKYVPKAPDKNAPQ
jgi:cytochrome c-type biogenesis protein CcmE